MRPLIFVSNDDGYNYPGLKALIEVAREFGDVIVAAPLNHQSGKASSITMAEPLRVIKKKEELGLTVYAVNGTPTDCAKLGLGVLVGDRKVDLVLSGVNHGFNHGNSVLYSGTLGVVMESAMAGLPSVAFSYGDYAFDADFTQCLPIMRHVIGKVLANGLPKYVCLSVNIPKVDDGIKGMKMAVSAPGRWTNTWEHRVDPRGGDYYWMLGDYEEENPNDERTDFYLLRHGFATVTPIHIDQTDHDSMQAMQQMLGI